MQNRKFFRNESVARTASRLLKLTVLSGTFLLGMTQAYAAPFAAGNLVVYRVGTGTGTLGNTATAVFLDEYTTAGVLVQSLPLPTADAGSNQILTASGSATSEGLLTRSADGRFITLTGYDAPLATASVATTPSTTISRIVGRVDASGTIDTSTALTDAYNGNNIRSSVTDTGTQIFTGGTAATANAASAGVRATTFGSTTSTSVSADPSNIRQVNIFGGQLYATTASANAAAVNIRLGTVGTGTPTSGPQPITNLPGITSDNLASPYSFVLLDLSPAVAGLDTLYVADDTALPAAGGATAAGIRKFSLVNGSFISNGTITLGSARGLTASVTGTSVSLFSTNGTSISGATDTAGYNAAPSATTATSIRAAGTNTAFRGLDFAPTAAPPPPATGPTGFAVVGSSLYSFPVSNPSAAVLVGAANAIGFAPDGIDFNPANGQLYALDVESTPGNTSLYTLNLTTGAATLVGSFPSAGAGNGGTTGPTTNTYSLAGQQIGFDFNPKTLQTDNSIRIRVTAQNGSDIRLNSATGGVAGVDGTLKAGTTTISVAGSAYTNNFAQISGGPTTLYDVSDSTDTLYIQNPPNNGTLTAVGPLVNANAMPVSGFDIFTGTGATANTAYLATNTDSTSGAEFFTVDLATGTATVAGSFGTLDVSDIAIQPLAAAAGVPFVTSITRGGAPATATAGTPVTFTVTFSKAVTGVDATDFTLVSTGNTTGAAITGVAGSGTTYTVTVGGFSGNGTFRLDLIDNDSVVDTSTVPLGGTGTLNGNFTSGETFTIGASATTGAILTEFRFHGATGSTDEYVEVRNKQNAPLDISGWSIRTNTGTAAAPVFQNTFAPNGTIIPVFGHFLFTGAGYSLGSYGSNVTPTTGTPTAIATDVPDNSGVALFNAAGTLQDAAGFAASNAALREGAGLPAYPTANGEYTFMRDFIISQEKDTDNSANDFVFVSTTGTGVAGETAPGTAATVAAQLGAPSPEGLTSPNYFNNQTISTLLDPSVASGVAPNRARITGGGTLGTLIVRRTIKNNTNVPITRLRLSVTSITSLNSAGFGNSAQADVRLVSGGGETGVLLANGTTMVNTEGTTLEAGTGQPQQPLGGGLGSSLNFGTVTLGAPLMPGASRNYNFRLQIERGGSYFIALNILALTQ